MIFTLSSQVRANDSRYLALQAVQSVLEQAENVPWDELTSESVARIELPVSVVARLRDARLSLTVSEEAEPRAKRIHAELAWTGRGGQPARPMRLSAWVFPDAPDTVE